MATRKRSATTRRPRRAAVEPANVVDEPTSAGEVRLTLDGRDVVLNQEQLGVTMQSTPAEILAAVQGVIAENLNDADGDVSFAVRKAMNSGVLYVYPKTVAGENQVT